MSSNTGFIGLGAMGTPMARNLHRAGLLTCVWNRSSDKARDLAAELAVNAAFDPAELAHACPLLFSCVSADQDLLDVVHALLPAVTGQHLLIDCSTVSARTAQKAASLLAEHGAHFLDAPVSGGVEGATNGTLAMMIGGNADDIERARPALQAVSARQQHMGPVGAGQATKAVNQIMAAGINQAVSEALAFADAQGLDMAAVIDVVGSGAAGNWFLSHRGGNMQHGEYPPGFRLALHHKDLRIAQAMAAEQGATLNSIEHCLADYAALMSDGYGDEDISALYRVKRSAFDGDEGV